MTPDRQRALLFLDIDGTLLPFGSDTTREPPGAGGDSYLDRLNPQVGPRLAALPCDLIWATTWEQEANTEMAPRLGLPSLPVVHCRSPPLSMSAKTSGSVCTGRPALWWSGLTDDPSSGSTTRSLMPTASGCPRIIMAALCFTTSRRPAVSSSRTSWSSTTGYGHPESPRSTGIDNCSPTER